MIIVPMRVPPLVDPGRLAFRDGRASTKPIWIRLMSGNWWSGEEWHGFQPVTLGPGHGLEARATTTCPT